MSLRRFLHKPYRAVAGKKQGLRQYPWLNSPPSYLGSYLTKKLTSPSVDGLKDPGVGRGGGGATLGLFGSGSAAGTLEPLAYTRASSSDFCCPVLG